MPTVPPDGWLVPAQPQLLEGDDRFSGASTTVLDFWVWAFSDLRDNVLRGVLAEFIVAAAVGQTTTRRKGWDNHDVTTTGGVRVEVKASGYLQSWAQAKHSRPSFARLAARTWDENTNEFGDEPEIRADAFVFAIQTCKVPEEYDALDIGQWEFYVVGADAVRAAGYKQLGLPWVERQAQPVGFAELAATIESVASAQLGGT